ncbi:MAG: hypothetical protein RJB61_1558 [Actinomycetota bacterium]
MPARRPIATRASTVAVAVLTASPLWGCDTQQHNGAATDPRPADTVLESNALVVGVVDGDTIDVIVEGRRERIRLIGIDTPETLKPDTPVECYGPEASARTDELLPASTPVRLERDIEPRDAFGRLLAYVYRAADGLFVNLHLVAAGFARPLPFEPNTAHAGAIASAAASARSQSLGLWAACSG